MAGVLDLAVCLVWVLDLVCVVASGWASEVQALDLASAVEVSGKA